MCCWRDSSQYSDELIVHGPIFKIMLCSNTNCNSLHCNVCTVRLCLTLQGQTVAYKWNHGGSQSHTVAFTWKTTCNRRLPYTVTDWHSSTNLECVRYQGLQHNLKCWWKAYNIFALAFLHSQVYLGCMIYLIPLQNCIAGSWLGVKTQLLENLASI